MIGFHDLTKRVTAVSERASLSLFCLSFIAHVLVLIDSDGQLPMMVCTTFVLTWQTYHRLSTKLPCNRIPWLISNQDWRGVSCRPTIGGMFLEQRRVLLFRTRFQPIVAEAPTTRHIVVNSKESTTTIIEPQMSPLVIHSQHRVLAAVPVPITTKPSLGTYPS